MLIATALLVLGLLVGVAAVQRRGLRMSGVLVVPLLAVYTLYNFATLPVFVGSAALAFAVLAVVKKWTLLYGRRVLIAGVVSGAIPPVVILSVLIERGYEIPFGEVVFVGSILPGVAAYNLHQLKTRRRQVEDLALSVGTLAGLLALGAALVRPVAASPLGTVGPPLLLGPGSEIAEVLGVSAPGLTVRSVTPFRVAAPVILLGLALSEFVQSRWGLRMSGIIATPLLALFAVQDATVVPLYLAVTTVTAVTVAAVTVATLLYGRVILSVALIVSAVATLAFVLLVPVRTGIVAFFTGIFAGISVYNFQRVQPGQRFASLSMTAAAFVVLVGILRYFVQPPPEGIVTTVGPRHAAVAAPVVAAALWQAYRLERRQPSLDEAGPVVRWWREAKHLVRRGREHRRRISRIDRRIIVSGTRGKSGTTERLHDLFVERGYDTMAKITGNRPYTLHNGERDPVERGSRVTMYENEHEIRKHTPEDVLILENQAITGYTNYVVNHFFVKPHVIFFTNVRQDHLDTLGSDRVRIARSFARSVPDGIHVVNGEQDERLRRYLEDELEPRGVTVTHVEVPEEHRDVPGAESIYGVSTVLEATGEDPLSPDQIRLFLDDMRVDWTTLPEGRIYNAAEVNDVESTEAVRRSLLDGEERPVTPFLYLRPDRRSRTASFLEYLTELHERGLIEEAHVTGAQTTVFDRKAPFPVVTHDEERGAGPILDDLLATDRPVLVMGNTVAEFMRDLEDEIDSRATEFEFGPTTVPADASDGEAVGRATTEAAAARSDRVQTGVAGTTDGDPRFPHALSVEAVGEGDAADYRFEITGDVRRNGDVGTGFDEAPTVEDGVVAGTVSDGVDSYRFSGRLLAVEVDGPATVSLDGERIDPDRMGEVRRVGGQ